MKKSYLHPETQVVSLHLNGPMLVITGSIPDASWGAPATSSHSFFDDPLGSFPEY